MLNLPKVPKVIDVATALIEVEARLVAIETDHTALRAEIATRRAADRLDSLEIYARANRELLRQTISALLVVLGSLDQADVLEAIDAQFQQLEVGI